MFAAIRWIGARFAWILAFEELPWGNGKLALAKSYMLFGEVSYVWHIIAKQHGGFDAPDNLALACHRCHDSRLELRAELRGARPCLSPPRAALKKPFTDFEKIFSSPK